MTHLELRQSNLPHLRLTPPQILELWESDHYTPKGYLYHLVLAHRRAGWWWRIDNVSEFCREWKINRRTFYRAKAALIHEGIFEESITGSIELRVVSTDVCVAGDTGVTNESPQVTDLAQPVTNGSQVAAETHSQQGFSESTNHIQIFKQLTTPEEVCVPLKNFASEGTEQEEILLDQAEAESEKRSFQANSEKILTPPILQRVEKLGVKVSDRILLRAIERWPERVPVALDCLEEKQPIVQFPTRFLQKAIEEDWQPERTRSAPSGFGDWFNEARRRGVVIASEMREGVIHVFTAGERWLPFEQLRRLSWDELSASAASGQAIPNLGT